MKILGIERDNTACNHYRILQPLYKLREHGLAEVLTIYERDFADLDYAISNIEQADVIVFQRPADEKWLGFIKACRKAGKVLVTDYDDDPFETSPLSPAYKFLGTEEVTMQWENGDIDELWKNGQFGFDIERNIKHRDMFKLNFKKADMVTTTTGILAETFKKINPNTVVLPNLLDFNLYPKCDMVKKNVRIGWQGGSSHYEDLHMMIEPLRIALEKDKERTFVYFGDVRFTNLLKALPKDQVEIHSWVPHNVYPYKLATLNLDIGLCPIVDNQFNRRKSAIKYFEYSVMGAATIASNIPPYSSVITNERDGILVENNTQAWVEAIDNMVKWSLKREDLAEKAYDNVYENYNADKGAHLWLKAYEGAIKAPVEV